MVRRARRPAEDVGAPPWTIEETDGRDADPGRRIYIRDEQVDRSSSRQPGWSHCAGEGDAVVYVRADTNPLRRRDGNTHPRRRNRIRAGVVAFHGRRRQGHPVTRPHCYNASPHRRIVLPRAHAALLRHSSPLAATSRWKQAPAPSLSSSKDHHAGRASLRSAKPGNRRNPRRSPVRFPRTAGAGERARPGADRRLRLSQRQARRRSWPRSLSPSRKRRRRRYRSRRAPQVATLIKQDVGRHTAGGDATRSVPYIGGRQDD